MNKEQLENVIATAKEERVKDLARAELQKLDLLEKAAQGDNLSKALLALKDVVDTYKKSGSSGGAGLSKDEIEKIVKQVAKKSSVSYDDLDAELRAKLSGQVKVQMSLTTPTGITSGGDITLQQLNRPLFQKLLSDYKAYNNVYLYGGAGTGKTYVVEQFADFLGYQYIEVNCNQFTSPLDLVGGQTIDGYQKGKLEIAWTNVDVDDNKFAGAILCLDELPKLDPNTAGLLNAALAKIKNKTSTRVPYIFNGKAEKIYLQNLFVVATGNTQLNEVSSDYEANFKQDLSLQDRFVGSTYEVVADYESEFENIMSGFAFIFIYLTKLREIILENEWAGRAFVSVRIMMNMRDSYIVYRDPEAQNVGDITIANTDADGKTTTKQVKSYAITKPKTIKQTLDSFINLFNESQQMQLREKSNYDEFINTIVPEKDRLPLNDLNTPEELTIVASMIKNNNAEQERANR